MNAVELNDVFTDENLNNFFNLISDSKTKLFTFDSFLKVFFFAIKKKIFSFYKI